MNNYDPPTGPTIEPDDIPDADPSPGLHCATHNMPTDCSIDGAPVCLHCIMEQPNLPLYLKSFRLVRGGYAV